MNLVVWLVRLIDISLETVYDNVYSPTSASVRPSEGAVASTLFVFFSIPRRTEVFFLL